MRLVLLFSFWVLCGTAVFGDGTVRHSVLQIGLKSKLVSIPVAAQPDAGSEEGLADPGFRQLYSVAPGPWGPLEYYLCYLQSPDQVWSKDTLSKETCWCFPGHTELEAAKQLEKIGIPKGLLQQHSYSLRVAKETRIIPSNRLIRSLSPDTRRKLRLLLRRWPERNPIYAYPIVIASGDPDGWFTAAGLAPETVSLLSSVCYTQGQSAVFSDIPYVLSYLHDEEEQTRFLKALSRTRTLVLRLNIDEQSNIREIRDYWTLGNQRKEISPFFDAITQVRGVEKLDTVHFLPPSARKRLYTFPQPGEEMTDCHSTCLEFCGVVSAPWSTGAQPWKDVFKTSFVPAKNNLMFGDVLVLFDSETGEPIHSAVYIAADIVFTKNGLSVYQPWVYMFWEDLVALYGFDAGVYARVYRRP
jgi:hypothetical protein